MVDMKSYQIAARVPLASPFSPNLVGPFRQVLTFESEKSAEVPQQRFLLVTAADSRTPELIERVP